MEQVHGSRVCLVDRRFGGSWLLGVDGLLTTDPAVVLVVRTADCLPLSVSDRQKRLAAVSHCGWKGLMKGILQNLLAKIDELEIDLGDLTFTSGAFIGPCCYHLDLASWSAGILSQAGVTKNQISFSRECTYCQARESFDRGQGKINSYRFARDRGVHYDNLYTRVAIR